MPNPIVDINICNGEALSLVKILIVPNKNVIALTKNTTNFNILLF